MLPTLNQGTQVDDSCECPALSLSSQRQLWYQYLLKATPGVKKPSLESWALYETPTLRWVGAQSDEQRHGLQWVCTTKNSVKCKSYSNGIRGYKGEKKKRTTSYTTAQGQNEKQNLVGEISGRISENIWKVYIYLVLLNTPLPPLEGMRKIAKCDMEKGWCTRWCRENDRYPRR